MWNAISTTDFEQRSWNNQTGLELKYNTISAIFLILSLFLRLSFLLVSSRTAIMKGLFLLLPLSCDLNINTVPLSLVAQFIDAISLSEEPVRALAAPLPVLSLNETPPLATKQFHPRPIGKHIAVHTAPLFLPQR